jgi:hypothetical protein
MSVVAPDKGLSYVGGSARGRPLSVKPSGSTALKGNMLGHSEQPYSSSSPDLLQTSYETLKNVGSAV